MLSDNIRKYRKENNMSQDELAERLNVSRQSISLWENGQTQPTIDNVISLTKIFNVSASELLTDEITPYSEPESDKSVPPYSNTIENNAVAEVKKKRRVWPVILVFSVTVIGIILTLAVSFFILKGSFLNNKKNQTVSAEGDGVLSASSVNTENFDLFTYCKNFAIQKGELNGDYTIYQQPSELYGGYENEYFSLSYWGDSDMVEFCLHCPLDDTYSVNFYLRMRGGYNGKYEYSTSRYYRSNGDEVRGARGYIDPAVFSDSYPLSCDEYNGTTDKQDSFMEESRVGICDLIKCLKEFVNVEEMECGFEAFGFLNF